MRNRIKTATKLDMELPSYVDDILARITDPKGRKNMDQTMDRVNKIVEVVARE